MVSSDKRIKYDIRDLDDMECLTKIRTLKPCKYKYRDIEKQLGNEHQDTIGFIAQEVKEVIPDAVNINPKDSREPDVIPNIQRLCDLSSNVLTIHNTSNITLYYNSNPSKEPLELIYDYEPFINDVIELRDDNKKYKVKITNIITSNIFNVSYESEIPNISYSKLFAYGTYIEDFNKLDKSIIYTIGIGAIQELDRQNIELKAENNLLKFNLNLLSNHLFGSNLI